MEPEQIRMALLRLSKSQSLALIYRREKKRAKYELKMLLYTLKVLWNDAVGSVNLQHICCKRTEWSWSGSPIIQIGIW